MEMKALEEERTVQVNAQRNENAWHDEKMAILAPRRQKERETGDQGCPEREDVMASEAEGSLGPDCAPVLRVWTLLV